MRKSQKSASKQPSIQDFLILSKIWLFSFFHGNTDQKCQLFVNRFTVTFEVIFYEKRESE